MDLAVTTAVDVQAKRTDRETKRTPNAHEENGVAYSRIDLSGKISLVSHRPKPIEIEVARYVLGSIARVDHDGSSEKLNPFESGEYLATTDLPMWWSWYNWPSGWTSLNGVGQANWKLTLEAGKSIELNYDWHYFWR